MKKCFLLFALTVSLCSLGRAENYSPCQLERINGNSFSVLAETESVDEALLKDVSSSLYSLYGIFSAMGDDDTAKKIQQFLTINKDNFTNDQLLSLKEKLSQCNTDTLDTLSLYSYKNPNTSLLLSIFLGGLGIDRFYIGDTGLGIGKLLTAGGAGVWWLIDLFCIQNATKNTNFDTVQEILNTGL